MRTKDIGNSSNEKTVWWKVDLGEVYSIYSINILFKNYDGYENRQRGRFAGFSLYSSNTNATSTREIQGSTLCYKNGPELPPLNFKTECGEYGRYVIFYNERLKGVDYPHRYELNNVFTELCEVIVQGCKLNFYGSNCDVPCPKNCNVSCHIQHGTCIACKPGWNGETCNTECEEGWYGGNCSQQCVGHCRGGTSCNHVTGECDKGCDAGWTGMMCDEECGKGTFGYDCVNNCSGHCLKDFPCNKQTGHCDGGCNQGYTDSYCSKECPSGYHGIQCKGRCSDHCRNNEPCDHVSGVCSNGCQDGYIGARCNNSCKEGYYGANCSLVCPTYCKTCRHTNGLCICRAGWMGSNCTEVFDATSISSANVSPAAVGGAAGTCVLFIIGVVIAVFVIRLKRRAKKITKRESIALETKSRFAKDKRPSFTVDDRFQNELADVSIVYAKGSLEKTKKGPPTNKNMSAKNIKAQIANMSSNESAGFKSEYQDIPRGELHPCVEAKKLENKVKNRYTTIYPYDHSRVILKTSSSVEGDYINANYIEDAQGKQVYIATQGPKPKTISDFWTMIWQEEVCNIVCLTNLKEGAKNKCAQYWPDINDKLQGGTLTIRHLEEKTYAEYILRRFKIHNKSTRSDRHVTMFHYTTWSDHGVADPLSLVVFHRHVIRSTAISAGKYTVVHCSAGVGRTGTYIALDALCQEGERTGKINVPMYVRTMRKDRMNMIQGDEQYKLLYLALMEAFSGPSRCMTTEKFVGAYQEQTCYTNCGDVVQKSSQSSEFEELLSLRKEYTQQDYTSGRAHISANYTESVLPVEEFMCHLSYIKGHNTYYNAVLLQSYLEKDSLISAQYPLPDNTEDFLRLIKDFNARGVVFLYPLKDIESHGFQRITRAN